jgi:hypothetical protein
LGETVPLIEQQDLVCSFGMSHEEAIRKLKVELEEYPPVKIISISAEQSKLGLTWLVAVVESV